MTDKIKPPFSFNNGGWAIRDVKCDPVLKLAQNIEAMLTDEERDGFLRWVSYTLNKGADTDNIDTSAMEIIGGEITVEFVIGTDIHDAFRICKGLIYKNGRTVKVKFTFNSVPCIVSFNSDWTKFEQQYESALHREVDGL